MNNDKLRVVLLSCCAPCSAGAIQQLKDGAIDGVDDFIVNDIVKHVQKAR